MTMCNPNRTPGNVEGVLQGAGWIWDTTKLPQGSFQPYIQWPIWLVVSYNRCCPYKSLSLSLYLKLHLTYIHIYMSSSKGWWSKLIYTFQRGLKPPTSFGFLDCFWFSQNPRDIGAILTCAENVVLGLKEDFQRSLHELQAGGWISTNSCLTQTERSESIHLEFFGRHFCKKACTFLGLPSWSIHPKPLGFSGVVTLPISDRDSVGHFLGVRHFQPMRPMRTSTKRNTKSCSLPGWPSGGPTMAQFCQCRPCNPSLSGSLRIEVASNHPWKSSYPAETRPFHWSHWPL